jgi:hypothetical protein
MGVEYYNLREKKNTQDPTQNFREEAQETRGLRKTNLR